MKELLETIIYELEMYHAKTDEDLDWVKDKLRRYGKLLREIEE
jgi:hypothetical protein